ncbi:dymeclin [Lingula anatina]|uniref:Dymeclin n=1 Tax=Lingula anatina TaxID=7574 RepID=A0A1S3K883_LINAN|nr:dymeclin [Lingula anatina]|eukprot:XP_013418845.1 dymeclin [Lingula anatina]
MGANSSSISELSSNTYLAKLCGTDPVSKNDPFWNQLLSFTLQIPHNSSDNRLLEESISGICKNLAINNFQSGNFGALVRVFLIRAAELKASTQCDDNLFIWQTYNALFIVRNICKYFVENLSEELLLEQFKAQPTGEVEDAEEDLCQDFLSALIELIVDVTVVSYTYALHLEALNCLLILLSIQMFQPQPAGETMLYRYIMHGKCSIHACMLMKSLLHNFVAQEKCPASLIKNHSGGLSGLTSAMASGLWTVMTLGLATGQKTQENEVDRNLLAQQSILLTLVLVNHCTNDREVNNPYRQALCSFMDSHGEAGAPTEALATFRMDFPKLYKALCQNMRDDQTTLLLYLLIHRNINFKTFVLSRTNLDQVVMPILKILYHAEDKNSHHIYMALIILLILSEDESFNKAVHELTITNIAWFKERTISEISLGGLLVLVVIRTIQYNMTKMRDKYLHTNCLAALANMSAQFDNLHPYVTQRLISLFALLVKKHNRLVQQLKNACLEDGQAESGSEADTEPDYGQDLSVLEEVIRMVLEIINSCLTHALHHNPNLIYTLLYNKEVFSQFRTHPTFQDIIQNVDTVLGYFTAQLEKPDRNLSVHEVLDIIKMGARQFKRERLKKFPELKFKYVEEDQPEEFFIPYVWSLVYHSSNLYFNASRIQLFSLGTTQG